MKIFRKLFVVFLMVILLCSCKHIATRDDEFESAYELTEPLFTGLHGDNHIQGIAVDEKNGFIYYSFTTKLIKSDFEGNIIGSVCGLYGHLGSIAFNENDGKVYGSLEYKHDSIGTNLIQNDNTSAVFSDGFYVAIFDVDRINKTDMSIENSDIMTAVHLSEVLDDYTGNGYNSDGESVEHKYGCSGIDGICFAPIPGIKNEKRYLYVAYGIYSDINRSDNDHQILLCYDIDKLNAYAKPFSQSSLHRSGPQNFEYKFFVYTGNTTYGVQNLTYDAFNNSLFMAVYKGEKTCFQNYDIFAVDMSQSAFESELNGINEIGSVLTLKGSDKPYSDRITGWIMPYGQCGLSSRDDGSFYVAEPTKIDDENAAYICVYDFEMESGFKKREMKLR